MLQCLSWESSSSAAASVPGSAPPTMNLHNPPPSHAAAAAAAGGGTSADGTPISSPTLNLTREYTLALQTNSYSEMWSRYHLHHHDHDPPPQLEELHGITTADDDPLLLLAQVLQPNRVSVEEALSHANPNSLTRLVSTYFDHSENTTTLCVHLHRSVYRARALYAPLYTLLGILPPDLDSLSHSQCNSAFDVFLQFDRFDNPFPDPGAHNFHDMRRCFSQLRQQLDRRLTKTRSRVGLVRRAAVGSVVCVIGSVLVVIASAVAIGAHALVAIVATPFCSLVYLPTKMTKKELAHVKQLEAAARGTYVLNNDLDTIDKLVSRLYTVVESDKELVRLGLERDRDRHLISEVLKQFRSNKEKFVEQLQDIEERICLCFSAVNRARSLLLQEIHLYQSSSRPTS